MMRVKDREIAKVNKFSIKRLESILDSIDKYEEYLLDDFNNNMSLIFGKSLLPILEELSKTPNIDKIRTRSLLVNGKTYKVPYNVLQDFHKSYITNPQIRVEYENRLKLWFSDKTAQLKAALPNVDSYQDLMKINTPAFALASLALTSFHKKPNMVLRDVQKMAGIVMSEGDIAELSSGEGKTLSAILPVFLQALRGKGVHVITSNGYLSKRDFEETLPIYEGLGLTSGYVPNNEEELANLEGKDYDSLDNKERVRIFDKLKIVKKKAYRCDITFGSKDTFAFDYLRDCLIKKKEDLLQRETKPGFALIDEVDDVLIDDAQIPYRIAINTPMYKPNMSLRELCIMQGIMYDKVLPEVNMYVEDIENLTYEEARYISNSYGKLDLMADPIKYQEAAERFFNLQRVFMAEDNKNGFKTGKELYRAILDDDKYVADTIRSRYGIIYCPELQEFRISDKCYEEFLKYCYFSFHINSNVIKYQDKIMKDPNYKEGTDYYLSPNKKIRLTTVGANRLIKDANYPLFVENYNQYLASISRESASVLHYFRQTVIAHLLMKNGEDYIVDNGKVKTLKNGRIQEGSTYSNGLHQAIELKENIPIENRTKETTTSSSITQKEFYSRYDLYSGMTGTSSKGLFGEIFGKGTVEIPKHAFYSFFGRRKLKDAKEPLGVLKEDTKFALNVDDKIKLIVDSVIKSKNNEPSQPVLIVVSDYDEISLIEKALTAKEIEFNTLSAITSKEDEALIISQAGLPGSVTISTEMAGRGTDIRVGGDRDTVIDIATERHIKSLERKQGVALEFSSSEKCFLREKVEKALEGRVWTKEEQEKYKEELNTTGLKVISSGYFKMTRVDRQLEGRTGRNGISGVCERFACPSDLIKIGVSSLNNKDSIDDYLNKYPKNPDGSLEIDEASYNDIENRIATIQKNNENEIKQQIKEAQQLNNYATKLIEEYREQRKKIICNTIDSEPLINEMIEGAVNAIISSYVIDKEVSVEDATKPINKSGLKLDIYAVCLEVKQVLGISFDPKIVEKSDINILELRDAIVRTAKERRSELGQSEDNQALLIHNDYMIANIPEILESSFCAKSLASMSLGLEGQKEALANIKFFDTRKKLLCESYKLGLRSVMGIVLSNEEFTNLEDRKRSLFSLTASKNPNQLDYDINEPKYKENNTSVIDKLKGIKQRLDKEDKKTIERIEMTIEKSERKGKEVDIRELYSNLHVRPMKFMNAIVDGKRVTKLVIIRKPIHKVSKNVKNASSK